MIRFFHTADVHFGVENYGKIDPETGIHTRLLDFQKSFATCVDEAVREQVDFFVLAGDAYKTAYPTPTQQRLLMGELFKLYAAKIPVVIVVGNHDHPLSFGKANALDVFGQLPIDGFHVFSKPDLIRLETKNGPVQIVGIPWPTRHVLVTQDAHRGKKTSEITAYISAQVCDIIAHYAKQVDPNLPAILTGHLTVSNGVFSGSEKCAVYGADPLFLPSQLALPMFDYVALGHLHRYQDLNAKGYPAVVYAGSIDRVDFGERKETKGYCDVQIEVNVAPAPEQGRLYATRCTHTFVPLKTRPFIQIELSLRPDQPATSQVLDAIRTHTIEDAIVKVVYHVPEGMTDRVDINAVSRLLRPAMHVVGVFPVHAISTRQKRLAVHHKTDFDTLLQSYFESRPELASRKKRLTEKAKELHVTCTQESAETT